MKNKKGFTLIELIITIIIVGILSAVAVPMYKKHIKKSYESEGWALLSQIQTVQKVYYAGYNCFAGQEEVEKEIDPSSNKYFTSYSVDGGGTQAWTAVTDGINEADGISLTMVGSANGSVATYANGTSESGSGSESGSENTPNLSTKAAACKELLDAGRGAEIFYELCDHFEEIFPLYYGWVDPEEDPPELLERKERKIICIIEQEKLLRQPMVMIGIMMICIMSNKIGFQKDMLLSVIGGRVITVLHLPVMNFW